jgi:hypothetical protein
MWEDLGIGYFSMLSVRLFYLSQIPFQFITCENILPQSRHEAVAPHTGCHQA